MCVKLTMPLSPGSSFFSSSHPLHFLLDNISHHGSQLTAGTVRATGVSIMQRGFSFPFLTRSTPLVL
uniref:Uncharacterized protein n=1 Tax=Utricularia reniformis TaxID=192314 RepID=A0A1Y0AZZ0_9LAMI|nr:hypothetical protein AEK19_MT0436 [Utricularia reniformis]ART30699.1 hypothetical protein AEK19_MT0436 [Utricularia reniformis]